MGFSLKKLVEGAVAQVNPFDNGKTFATVQRNQPAPPAQIPQQGMAPQAQAQIQNARYGVLANNPKRQRAFIGSVSQPQLKAFNPILEAPKVIAKEAVPTVGAGIGRSIVGAAEGISGAADLLTPGTGTNRVTKALVNQGRNIDQYVERNNFDKTGYKIAQGTTDIASFLAPGAIAKGASLAAKTGGVTGKVGKALSSTAPLIDKPVLKYATSPANILNTGVGTARSQGYIASREQDVNPGTVGMGLGANLLLGTGANVVGSKVVEPLVNSNIGKNIKDGFNVAVSKPQAPEELLNKQSKLLTARAALEVKNKPTGSIDSQISNVGQQIRQATTRPILRPFTNEGGFVKIGKQYDKTYNVNDKADAEYLARIVGEDRVKQFQAGDFSHFRGGDKGYYEGIVKGNLVSEIPKTTAQQLEGRVKPFKLGSSKVYHVSSADNTQSILKNGFKKGSELPENAYRGGGYGQMQDSISFATKAEGADRFATNGRGVLLESELKPNSKVVEIKGVEYAEDLNDFIPELRKQGVDAVHIGGGENEVVVINPKSIKGINRYKEFDPRKAKDDLAEFSNKAQKPSLLRNEIGAVGKNVDPLESLKQDPQIKKEYDFFNNSKHFADNDNVIKTLAELGDQTTPTYKALDLIRQERELGGVEKNLIDISKRTDATNKQTAQAKQVAKKDLDGFTEGKSALQRGKIEKTLDSRIRYNGEVMSKRDYIRKLIKDGYVPDEKSNSIYSPNDRSNYQAVSKTEADYARHLYTQSQPPKSPQVGTKVSYMTSVGEKTGTITKVPDTTKDLRIKGNSYKIKFDEPVQVGMQKPVKETYIAWEPGQDGLKVLDANTQNTYKNSLVDSNRQVKPAKSQSPLTVEKTPRTQLTGRALDVPSKTGDPIADALGMSPKTLKEAQTVDPLAQVPSKKKDPVSKYDNIEVGDDGVARHKTYDLNKKVSAIDYLRTPENVLKKIGLAEEGRVLVKAQRELKKELPQQIDKISSWYDRVGRKPEASQRIFRWLDGQKGAKLTGEELAVGKEMKSYFKDWADRLNLPEDRRISNYITHIFDDSLLMKEFDPDLEKLIADQVPGSVYDPYTLQRLGKQGYIEDAFLAAEAYAKRATRKAHMDPALEQLKAASQDLDQSGLNFVKQLGDRVNMRPTQLDNLIDNAIKQGPVGYKFGQRPVAALSRNIRQMTYRATLGLNVGSAVRNLTQGVNTFAELGTEYTTKGYIKALKSLADGSDELQKVGVLDNSFIEDRTVSAMKKGLQRVDKGLWAFFSGAEKINRGAAYFGAKQKALAEGKPLDEAIDIALDTARKTQFTFGAVDTPVLLQSDIVKLATQFQSFNVKQTEFIAGMVKNGEWDKVARFVGATGFMMLVMGQLLNYKPQDFIPFANELGKGNAPIAKTPVWQMTGALLKGDLDKAAQSAGATFVPAFVQGKKTVQGIKAVQSGEVKSGNKKYPVEQSPRNMVKGAVFGPYALKPADGKTITDLKKEGMAVNGETDKKTIVNASFNSPEAKKFFELTEDEQRKQAANNPELYALMKQKDAMQKALGTPTLNPGLSEQDKKVLTKAARLTQKAEDEVSYREKDYDYKKLLANYNKNKLEGNITEEEDIKQQKALKKAEVGAQFDKGIRKLYELSKTDLQAKLKDQPNAKEIIAQLEAYDKALVDSKYHAYLKFKNGVMAVSGGKGKRGGRRGGRKGSKGNLSTQLYAFNSSPVGTNRTLRQLVANAKVKGAKSKKIKTKIA